MDWKRIIFRFFWIIPFAYLPFPFPSRYQPLFSFGSGRTLGWVLDISPFPCATYQPFS